MQKAVKVRFLVPKRRHKDGRIDYHVETRVLRLPLKRGDRELLKQRMEG